MARRGDALHAHIIDTAKTVFLESGYDRASMDAVAAAASTSKRSLYAHFSSKDALFTACVDRSHELFEGRLAVPSRYSDDPVEAIVRYCLRFGQLLTYAPIAGFCRMGVTEAARLPEAAAQIHDTFLGTATTGLAGHIERCWAATPDLARQNATLILGAAVGPLLTDILYGLIPLRQEMPDETATPLTPHATTQHVVTALLPPPSSSR
ncbi:TetR family transcriptional regulator [Microlunatus endophyticus]|uniref:TetR family transcriptional regulator n=1 Tax=Microlunatus endophyticus TaxID=1716077 RepID=A0A917SID7_9ACTN|nr:TetR/AcrR family transcriptional regulator [Microlunatus endophyticus]GGL80764.1 TetR family transcriptional regulator [Microlunatus endophyticus]